jgi:hypothetical protein
MELPSDKKLNIQSFENMLELNRMTNSYKLYWFAAIFKEIKLSNTELTFKRIVLRMITKCWYSIVEYRLNLGSQDKLGELVLLVFNKYKIEKDITEDELIKFLYKIAEDEEIFNRINDFYKYVPYRLLSSFFPELVRIKDYKKNSMIEELSNKDERSIYRISSDKIIINPNWFDYIYKNQIIIEGWLNYKLVYFLQNRNPNVPAIPFKLSAPQQRNLTRVKKYWNKIIRISPINDIYTGGKINKGTSISIDHFIPWSFVLHDKLWNLIPTFKEINSSKSNKLPDLDAYLNKFCLMQYYGFKTAINNNFSKKQLEDYIELNKKIRISRDIPENVFISSLKETINPLYQIALNQGFLKWGVR